MVNFQASTSGTVDANGSPVSRLMYTAFGETRYENGATPTDYRYTGQREEAELGLYFYNARWYDPSLGRFTQPDSIVPNPGNPMDWDRYAYVVNNPVNSTDPTGHRECDYDCQVEYQNADPTKEYYCAGCEWDVAAQQENQEIAETILYDGTELAASILFEPADWAFTAYYCIKGDCGPLMLLGLLPIIPSSLGSHGDDLVDLYRAVGPDELADLEKTGIFRIDPSGKSFSTGKWFATSAEDAAKWGEAMSNWDNKGYSVVQVSIPKSLLGDLNYVAKLDGIGPAYFAPVDQLIWFTLPK